MKTTVDIPDALLREAKKAAAHRKTTVKALVESGLRKVLSDEGKPRGPFRLRKHTFRGRGLQPGITEGDWREIRRLVYEGRGG